MGKKVWFFVQSVRFCSVWFYTGSPMNIYEKPHKNIYAGYFKIERST